MLRMLRLKNFNVYPRRLVLCDPSHVWSTTEMAASTKKAALAAGEVTWGLARLAARRRGRCFAPAAVDAAAPGLLDAPQQVRIA